MKAVVLYESMYGNTHLVATAIGRGLAAHADVEVKAVETAGPDALVGADLVVVGGPTHAHGMSRSSTREAAVHAAQKPDADLELDPDAEGPGVREWLAGLPTTRTLAAAFDTRMHGPAALTGRASKGIARALRAHGFTVPFGTESFFVAKDNHLVPDEDTRAQRWGDTIGAAAQRQLDRAVPNGR